MAAKSARSERPKPNPSPKPSPSPNPNPNPDWEARELLVEFGGPVSDKAGARLREATLTDLKAVFEAIDDDGSGFIDATELKRASAALGFQLQGSELNKAFAAMDLTPIPNPQIPFDT